MCVRQWQLPGSILPKFCTQVPNLGLVVVGKNRLTILKLWPLQIVKERYVLNSFFWQPVTPNNVLHNTYMANSSSYFINNVSVLNGYRFKVEVIKVKWNAHALINKQKKKEFYFQTFFNAWIRCYLNLVLLQNTVRESNFRETGNCTKPSLNCEFNIFIHYLKWAFLTKSAVIWIARMIWIAWRW